MIYLYGLFEGNETRLAAAIAGMSGLQDRLDICAVGPWKLVWSRHDTAAILPKRRLMLAHTRVLEKMMTEGTVLPARFGLVADTLDNACSLIAAQKLRVGSAFDRVRGHVELGVRVSFPRPPALAATLAEDAALARQRDALLGKGPEAHFAVAAFGGRLAEQLDRRRGSAQSSMLKALRTQASDHVLRRPEEDTEVLRAEFLVKEDDQEAFVAAVIAAAHALSFAPGAAPHIQIIGPAPMYNFVQLSLALDSEEVTA